MKTTLILLQAALMMALFSSCSKEPVPPAEDPIQPGEFYIRAAINGQPLFVFNGDGSASFNGNSGLSIGVTGNTVETNGSTFTMPGNRTNIMFALSGSLTSQITTLTGRRIPFLVQRANGSIAGGKGALLDISDPADWQLSWMAGSNADSSRYYADIISVTPYKKGQYNGLGSHEYFRVTLRFTCRLLANNGEVDALNGEAAILVSRQR
jgi:hypothetical protein